MVRRTRRRASPFVPPVAGLVWSIQVNISKGKLRQLGHCVIGHHLGVSFIRASRHYLRCQSDDALVRTLCRRRDTQGGEAQSDITGQRMIRRECHATFTFAWGLRMHSKSQDIPRSLVAETTHQGEGVI
jgi:hypothetical protein